MSRDTPVVKSLWFSSAMSVLSLLMVAEYTRLVLTTDDSRRRWVVLFIWVAVAVGWIATAIVRWRARRTES